MKRTRYIGAAFAGGSRRLWRVGSHVLQKRAAVEAAGVQAPRFEVDPDVAEAAAEPLGDRQRRSASRWMRNDHIWIIHRAGSLEAKEQYATMNPPAAECCAAAPPVLEFDEAGNLIGHWGGPGEGYDWPASNHGIDVDYKGNVWIGGNGRGTQPAALPPTRARWARAPSTTTWF